MNYDVKEFLKKFFNSRLFVLGAVLSLFFIIVLVRVFTLQIVNGESYQENFTMLIQKTLSIDAARGNIYDCNGNLLAYNELAYSVVISDNGTYDSTSDKNEEIHCPTVADTFRHHRHAPCPLRCLSGKREGGWSADTQHLLPFRPCLALSALVARQASPSECLCL